MLFLVAWHFFVYTMALFLEFSPAVAEWAGLEKARKILSKLTLGTVILGFTISMLHQSGLGALFLMAKPKIHPLWYSEYLPLLFFISSIYAGLSMIIFEGTISHKVFKNLIGEKTHHEHDQIVLGLAKGAAVTMFVYYFFEAFILLHDGERYKLVTGFWGFWYLLEIIGFVLVPCFMYAYGVRNRNLGVIKVAAIADGAGRHSEPAEHHHDCIQLVCAESLLSVVAGDRHHAHGGVHRSMGLPLDRDAHAGLQQSVNRRQDGILQLCKHIRAEGRSVYPVAVLSRSGRDVDQIPGRARQRRTPRPGDKNVDDLNRAHVHDGSPHARVAPACEAA